MKCATHLLNDYLSAMPGVDFSPQFVRAGKVVAELGP
jgi:hypothetical protein